METKQYTQFGKFSVALLVPLFIITFVLIFVAGHYDIKMGVLFVFISLLMLICVLTFYKLTIYISDTHISFVMGAGLVRREYSFAGIEDCKPVKNNILTGIGIRLIPGGWLFNVSGRKAIELTFRDKRRKIRIGTDRPEEIASLVKERIGKASADGSTDTEFAKGPGIFLAAAVLIIIMLFPAIMILNGKRETEISVSNDLVSIKGMYPMDIRYSDITGIDTISDMPHVRSRTNGYALGKTLKGNFRLSDGSKVKLYMTKGVPPYIKITTQKNTVYINYPEAEKTRQLYRMLKTQCK